ncbi:MAG: hypothetical protein H0U49_08235 [Parachlamydiaceae bacterium]|nr:hypothetical protein [Parachlamydiaceae bacterium]
MELSRVGKYFGSGDLNIYRGYFTSPANIKQIAVGVITTFGIAYFLNSAKISGAGKSFVTTLLIGSGLSLCYLLKTTAEETQEESDLKDTDSTVNIILEKREEVQHNANLKTPVSPEYKITNADSKNDSVPNLDASKTPSQTVINWKNLTSKIYTPITRRWEVKEIENFLVNVEINNNYVSKFSEEFETMDADSIGICIRKMSPAKALVNFWELENQEATSTPITKQRINRLLTILNAMSAEKIKRSANLVPFWNALANTIEKYTFTPEQKISPSNTVQTVKILLRKKLES